MNNNELVEADAVDTKVGRAILIKGEIEGDGNVVVEGRVEGNIAIKGDLHIAIDGQVKSSVSARNIFVQGILVGSATAFEKIELAQGGRMIGDVRAPRFLINEGAAYKGTVDMVDFEPEERSGETQRTTRQSGTARPQTAKTVRPLSLDPRRESLPRPPVAKPSSTTAAKPAVSNVYTPPPLPRPPEFVGIKKAIIVKKKSSEGE